MLEQKTQRVLAKPAGVKQEKGTQVKIYSTYILCEYLKSQGIKIHLSLQKLKDKCDEPQITLYIFKKIRVVKNNVNTLFRRTRKKVKVGKDQSYIKDLKINITNEKPGKKSPNVARLKKYIDNNSKNLKVSKTST